MASTEPTALPVRSAGAGTVAPNSKTLILCCDGTWENAVGKISKSGPPTNVSRLIRGLRQATDDGRPQIVLYHAGVGSSGQFLDSSIGGTFGLGLDQDIRELYNFICTNYVDGDAVVLVGFSRGAFTARSVADLIASVGLLTPDGLDRFYDIFEDYENLGDKERDPARYLCRPPLEPYRGETGTAWIQWENRRKTQYRAWLKKENYTRDTFADGKTEITIRAVAVWDTVGCLGIPAAPVIGLKGSAQQYISQKVEHAFQALGLDEPRYDFLPSLWERLPENTTTRLKQVWFPGSHTNIGGGQYDQQLANLTLAWMCDQLASVGVAFDEVRLTELFRDGLRYSAAHPFPFVPSSPVDRVAGALLAHHKKPPLPWARRGVFATATAQGDGAFTTESLGLLTRDTADCPGKYLHHHPDGTTLELWRRGPRPWALGQTRLPTSFLQMAAGTIVRRPAQFVRVDPATNNPLPDEPLLNTDERVHASVRVRLACGGLSMDDRAAWTGEGLTGEAGDDKDDDAEQALGAPLWRLQRVDGAAHAVADRVNDSDIGSSAESYYPLTKLAGAGHWQWVYARDGSAVNTEGPHHHHGSKPHGQWSSVGPSVRVLPEELPTGRWERLLLAMTVGDPDVLAWAAANPYPNNRE